MEIEKNKKKIKLKGDLKKNKLFLKKDFIYESKKDNCLTLDNEIKTLTLDNEIKTLTLDNEIKTFTINSKKNSIIPFKIDKNYSKETILSIESISKNFNGRPILKNISFNLKRGQVIGLLGPNGCGKTTLFRSISGEISPDSGDIIYDGQSIISEPIHIRARKGISYLQTHKGLFDNLTAYENLYAVLELHMDNKDKIEQRIFKLLSYFGLQYLTNIKSRHFSAGEVKKVACLQRICNTKTNVLLMDEPLSALDPLSIESIKKFILEIKKINNMGVIITEHNVRSVADILDYVILIRNGEVMAEGTMREVSKNKDVIKYYLGSDFRI